VEHEHGWRAQYAYPLELWLVSDLTNAASRLHDALQDAYGIPVHYPAAHADPLTAWSLQDARSSGLSQQAESHRNCRGDEGA
jgi:hypothetical protein